ncbi:MAG: Vgb family protein [Planctomycetota bacterium]|jgi:sugar lactone lactonase YvrE
MKLVSRLAVLGLAVVLVPTALFAQFDQQDYYVSAPGAGGIWRGDADTGVTSPHALGLLVPHYGWFGNDGNFYMPDRGWPAVMRIEPDGTVTPIVAGAPLVKPVTVIPTLDDQAFILSDMEGNSIYRMEYDGTLTLLHDLASTNGLLNWPDGMAFDTDDNLYVANLGNDHIVKIDPAGNASLFFDDPLLVREPGGIAIDNSGNMFVANYALHTISRIRLDTGVAEVLAGPDSTKMAAPSDLKLARSGGLLASGRNGRVTRIDALGNMTVEIENPALSELVGVSVLEDESLCTGRYEMYGTGQAGSGGMIPQFRALFSPCPGQTIGLEMREFWGGAQAVLFVSSAGLPQGAATFKGAPLLVDPGAPIFFVIPLVLPGAGNGPGTGNLTLQFKVPETPALAGLELYHQIFAGDPGAPNGVSASNGLKETFGL